ncbi:hypothetical protein Pelo_13716 [Pelomyxa schiedti]|nr:hypothetical protein Pelo_13716 [Pelomyxa schiedti]
MLSKKSEPSKTKQKKPNRRPSPSQPNFELPSIPGPQAASVTSEISLSLHTSPSRFCFSPSARSRPSPGWKNGPTSGFRSRCTLDQVVVSVRDLAAFQPRADKAHEWFFPPKHRATLNLESCPNPPHSLKEVLEGLQLPNGAFAYTPRLAGLVRAHRGPFRLDHPSRQPHFELPGYTPPVECGAQAPCLLSTCVALDLIQQRIDACHEDLNDLAEKCTRWIHEWGEANNIKIDCSMIKQSVNKYQESSKLYDGDIVYIGLRCHCLSGAKVSFVMSAPQCWYVDFMFGNKAAKNEKFFEKVKLADGGFIISSRSPRNNVFWDIDQLISRSECVNAPYDYPEVLLSQITLQVPQEEPLRLLSLCHPHCIDPSASASSSSSSSSCSCEGETIHYAPNEINNFFQSNHYVELSTTRPCTSPGLHLTSSIDRTFCRSTGTLQSRGNKPGDELYHSLYEVVKLLRKELSSGEAGVYSVGPGPVTAHSIHWMSETEKEAKLAHPQLTAFPPGIGTLLLNRL